MKGDGARLHVLGTPIDGLTMAEAVTSAERFIADKAGAHIVTANPEIVMRARSDAAFAAAIRAANVVLPDGIGIVWASRLLRRPVPERVPGIELTEALLQLSARRGYSVYFLGAEPGVAAAAVARLRRTHPDLSVSGHHHGYFTPTEEQAVIDEIQKRRPDILFVGLGAPRQELFIARLRSDATPETRIPLAIGVGGTIDVLGGRARRAPGWTRTLGMEWLYRGVTEPRRLGRLAVLPRFVGLVLLDAWRRNLL